jgi:hypothetical protein
MDPAEEVLMGAWETKGCEVCRKQWEVGQHPPELAVSIPLHTRLHRCSVCGTYWIQEERYADVIQEEEARRSFPEAFS